MTSDQKIKQALKWWSYRQSIKFFLEAEKIRDSLLQESFSIRRSLDILAIESVNLSNDKNHEYIKKFENFHHSLVQLTERLCPASIQDSLPLSIECLLETWLTSHPHLYFQIDVPGTWRKEPAEHSLIILRALEELLTIALPQVLTPISIYISLKQKENLGQLTVQISYPDVSTLIFHSSLPELEYLGDSFRFLMAGQCCWYSRNLRLAWDFCW